MLKASRRPWRPWRCLNVLCTTLERLRQPFGLLSAFNGDLASFVVAQGRHKGRSHYVKGVLIPPFPPLKAEGRPNGCLGRSRVAHRTFRHRHGRHGRREVLSMFKTVAQRSPRRSVAHRSLKGGRMKAHTSPWSQNGCTVVGHWSPSKSANIVYQFERHVCLPCTTIVPPLASAFFARPVVALQQFWSFKEGTRVVLQQLHRNRTFWVPETTERPNHFYGHTKVARRSQPCVKGA